MKKMLLCLAIAGVALLSSCGGNGSSNGSMSTDDANSIIDYYNASLEVMKKAYNSKNREAILEYMQKQKQSVFRPTVSGNPLLHPRDTTMVLNPGSYFSKGVADSLTACYRAYFNAGKKMYDNYNEYQAYLKAEDYKDDKYAKAIRLYEENKKLNDEISAAKTGIFTILAPLAEQAEEVCLTGNPLKDQIMAAKQIFNTMETLIEDFVADKVDTNAIEANYAELEKEVAAARNIPAVGSAYQKTSYTKFLNEVEAFMGVLRKAKRDNKFNESNYKDLTRAYEITVNQYNFFVN